MKSTQWLARAILIGCLFTTFRVIGTSQTKNVKQLAREDIVIHQNRPTVYLCLDRPDDGKGVIWLRIANNTVWSLRFRAERQGTNQRLLRLSKGKNVAGLTGDSTAFPRYEFETADHRKPEVSPRGDFSTSSWLPPGTSALFAVTVPHSETAKVYLEYKYEWEFTSAIADESYGPVHRVYFDVKELKDFAAKRCSR